MASLLSPSWRPSISTAARCSIQRNRRAAVFVKLELDFRHWGKELRLGFQWHCQRVSRRKWLLLLSSAVATALVVSSSTCSSAWALTEENLLFLEAWRTIDRAYVDKSFNGQSWFRYRENALRKEPMNTRDETYAAIRKMLATLGDPFTRFLEPEKLKVLQSGTSGALIGVGVEVGLDRMSSGSSQDAIVVVTTKEGSPASRAGILPGDLIRQIDGQPVEGLNLYEAVGRLQGPEGSSVELTLFNKESAQQTVLSLKRERIVLNPVSWRLCEIPGPEIPWKVGYIRLSTFNQNAVSAVKQAIDKLHADGASAYVLDIRNNGGGFFPAVIDIAKMWLNKGVIVYIADSMGIRDIYEADGVTTILPNEPLAVLVNKGTASASEILAGALKDNKRAVILGETTFGKGKIQSVFQLSDGSGLAVTTARYQTPLQLDIDQVGIAPDVLLSDKVPKEGDSFCSCLRSGETCSVTKTTLFSKP